MIKKLDGKTAVITGATESMGRLVARRMVAFGSLPND